MRQINQSLAAKSHNHPFRSAAVGLAAVTLLICSLSVHAASAKTTDASWQSLMGHANTELGKGDISLAIDFYKQALLRAQKHKTSADDIVACQDKLANALALDNKAGEAARIYRAALATIEHNHGKSDPRALSTLLALGSLYESIGEHGSAATFYQRALAVNEKNSGPFDPALAQTSRGLVASRSSANTQPKHSSDLSALADESALSSSQAMKKLITDRKDRDRLRGNDDMDDALVKDFQKQILQSPYDSSLSDLQSATSITTNQDLSARM